MSDKNQIRIQPNHEIEQEFATSSTASVKRREKAARERAGTKHFRALMAALVATTVVASAEVVRMAEGNPGGGSNIESIIPGSINSGLDKGGKTVSFVDHPRGAVIETIAPDGQEATGYVAWGSLTPAQQSEALYEQTHKLESDQP